MIRHRTESDLTETLTEHLDPIMASAIEQGVFPGGVALARLRNEVVVHRAYGHATTHRDAHTRITDPAPAHPDTIYDLASITKLFTATTAMTLVDQGMLGLDDTVAQHLPKFAVNGKAGITVRHLLLHTAGLPMCRFWEEAPTLAERMRRVVAVKPEFPPGSAMVYHDTNLIVLGAVIEEVEGSGLDEVMRQRVLDPLGQRHTQFGPVDAAPDDIAATEDESYVGRGMVRGAVHDENAWVLGGVAGHAGLFGTARDLSIFGQMYLNGGTHDGVRVLAPETVAEMTRNQIEGLGDRGLGWQLNAPHYMGGLASPQTYGHTGFTGTSIVIDPRRDLVVVLLTNRVHPTRNGPKIDPVRRAVSDAVLDAIDAV